MSGVRNTRCPQIEIWGYTNKTRLTRVKIAPSDRTFFHYDYSSSNQQLPLEFLVELLKFPLPTQCALPVLEPLCLEYAPKKV